MPTSIQLVLPTDMRIHLLLSILLFSSVFLGKAQEISSDSTVIKRTFIPSIYIDYGKLLTLPLDIESKFEGGFELLIKEKVPIVVEAGMGKLTPNKAYSNGEYESKGKYVRVGTGIYSQFLPKNKLGFLFKYGVSLFDEKATVDNENTINIPRTLVASFDRKDITASWIEFVLYSDRQITDFLAIGMNLRLRYLLLHDGFTPNDVLAIPGYGRSFDTSVPAVNLFVKFSL